MSNEKKRLSLQERWALDAESANKYGKQFITSSPQCNLCLHKIEGNALNCEKYQSPDMKPKNVLSTKVECPEFKHKNILQLDMTDKEKMQLMGGIFGFCVADALGVPVEFSSREERKEDPVKEMRAYGTYHQYFGTWSDDSSLTFCLMDSLKEGYSINDIAKKFTEYYYENLWTPFGEVFDIGITTVAAIERMKLG